MSPAALCLGKETHEVNPCPLQPSAWGHAPSHVQSVEVKQNTEVLLSKGWGQGSETQAVEAARICE